jgi:hypothetical protein
MRAGKKVRSKNPTDEREKKVKETQKRVKSNECEGIGTNARMEANATRKNK